MGGFHERAANETKIANTHAIVDSSGELVASYRKVHLFDVDVDGGFKESSSTLSGTELLLVKNTPIGNVSSDCIRGPTRRSLADRPIRRAACRCCGPLR